MLDLPLQGSIADLSFPRLIGRLHREGFEGALRVSHGATTKVVYLRAGEIASAASNAESDRLANILIRDGRLSQEQLDLARSRLQPGGSLGKALIDMGFLTPTELLQGARQQVREILTSCFGLNSGQYQLEPGPLPAEVTSLGLPTRRLVFDCVLEARDRQWIIREIGSMESVYRPTETLAEGLDALKLATEMDQLGRMIDGSQTLRDLSGRTRLDDFTVSKVILALELLGLAERIGEPPPAAIPAATPAARTTRTIPVESAEPTSSDVWAAEPVIEPAGEPRPAPAGEERQAPPEEPPASTPPMFTEAPPVAEPPPIPPDELPAFAVPPGEEANWQIDPATGERVRLGPVEMTFDGAVGEPGAGSRRPLGLLLGIGAVVTVLIAALIYLYGLRRGATEIAAAGAHSAADAGAVVTAPTPGPVVEPGPAGVPGPTPVPSPAAVPKPTALPQPTAVPAPDMEAAGPAEPPAPAGSPAVGPAPAGDPRHAAALRQFDEGDADGSAAAFRTILAGQDPARLTLQLMIACQVESVRKARALPGAGEALFFVPYALGDRACYRVCWGLFDDRAAADAAVGALPAPLTAGGARPVPVSLGKLLKPPA